MGILGKIWDTTTDVLHAVSGIPTASQKRDQMSAINGQINAYKKSTELAQAEIARKRGEEAIEKRRIEEKQIRSLRRSFKPAGFLDNGGLNDTLGG